MLGLWIKKLLTTDEKLIIRAFRTAYTFNNQCYGSIIIFVIVKTVLPDTHKGCSDIKSNMDTMNMSQLKHDIPRSNL